MVLLHLIIVTLFGYFELIHYLLFGISLPEISLFFFSLCVLIFPSKFIVYALQSILHLNNIRAWIK